jgi:hypothetical protein
MQRKNSILMRRGIAMIMAIAVIVVLGTIMALSLSLTAETSKKTTDLYLHEQAKLLARSATEYTLLFLSGEDRSSSCTTSLSAIYPKDNKMFDINISVLYIGLDECSNYINSVNDSRSKGSIILDVVVTSVKNLSTEPIRYHRRTLQKL